jgi:hypothetical protein
VKFVSKKDRPVSAKTGIYIPVEMLVENVKQAIRFVATEVTRLKLQNRSFEF